MYLTNKCRLLSEAKDLVFIDSLLLFSFSTIEKETRLDKALDAVT